MKLSKLYANDNRFKTIKFNEGFNVIFGDVEGVNNQDTGKVFEHNIGKTALVHLIDFLLLKKVSKDFFFKKHELKFSNWVFFLEVQLNDKKFVTIRRAVSPNANISFKEHFSKDQDFSEETNWDYDKVSINTKDEEKNPKNIFENKYLKFDINTEFKFRSFLSYLLRTQDDYQDVFRLNKFKGKEKDWKSPLFNLLGFDTTALKDKYDLDSDINDEKKFLAKLQAKTEDPEIYTIKAAIEAKEIEKQEIQVNVDSFNFYKKEQNISFDLVKNVENEIARLNKESYLTKYNIEQVKKSLDTSNKPSLQIEDLKKLFEEVKVFFPQNLSKDYQDVLTFSTQITKEREKYLMEELVDLNEREANTNKELKKLNNKRGELLSLLNEKDTFIKFKKYQEEIIKVESEILSFRQRLNEANTMETYQKSLEESKGKIKGLNLLIKEEIIKDNPNFTMIKKIFQDIYKKTFEYTALLIIKPLKKSGNIEFQADVLGLSENSTGKGDGYTSKKVLCASFVLAILIHYSSNSFFKFAYHDGVLESWGDNHKIRFIKLMREYCKQYGIQYMISLIKSDVPNGFEFTESEIIRKLSNDDKLFGFEF